MDNLTDPASPSPKYPVLVVDTEALMKSVVSQHVDAKEGQTALKMMDGSYTIVRVVWTGTVEPVQVAKTKLTGQGFTKRKAKPPATSEGAKG